MKNRMLFLKIARPAALALAPVLAALAFTGLLTQPLHAAPAERKKAASAVGATSFNVADRLAIINLLHSYGYFSDTLRVNEWVALFTEAPVMEFWQGDKKQAVKLSKFTELIKARVAFFKREKIQRRHVLSAPRFDRQTASEASGQVYVQLYSTKDGTPSLVSTGVYEFTAIKKDGLWKFSRWIGKLDSPLDYQSAAKK